MTQVFVLLLFSILTTVGAQLSFKKAMLGFGSLDLSLSNLFYLIPRIFTNLWLITGMFIFGISFILWLFIISKLKLNVAYPISLSCEVTLVTIISWFLFKEYLSFVQILGIIAIVIGIFLLLKT